MKKAHKGAKHPPVPPPKLIKPQKVNWKPPKMAEKKTSQELTEETPLHARRPETVDTTRDWERADQLRREQDALLKKQDDQVRQEQKEQDEKEKA